MFTQLNNQGIYSAGNVFYAGLDSSGALYVSDKQSDDQEKHRQYGIV